ncbi:hypothetical protein LshimejAT787_0309450 [Lyophyllum shimeji]|uniref:Uncharacterized protein n=1 Tax=Lyophyllum shimeji TaxID=47721 RepID=A0A9P3PIN2_LYOSH|nr:hypothetical protein LshimejAT787_0309450 [Lyophyllum shimeji]
MVLPANAPVKAEMKAEMRSWDAKARSPDPYDSFVPSAYPRAMVATTLSISSCARVPKDPSRRSPSKAVWPQLGWAWREGGVIVCRIVFARDVARVDGAAIVTEEAVDAFENSVGGFVATPALPPAFDNTTVVSEYLKLIALSADCEQGTDEELEANGFSPANVSAVAAPAEDEPPCSLPVTDGDADPNA